MSERAATTTRELEQAVDAVDSRSCIERVREHELPPGLSRVVDDYEATIGDRERFLWKWAHHLFPTFTLSCVPTEHRETVRDTKLLGLMFVSVLDDTAEKHGDRATFEEAAKIPFNHVAPAFDRDGVDEDVLAFAASLWDRVSPRLERAPRMEEFGEIARFDLTQVLNAIDYSSVANEDVAFVTGNELQTYEAHNMMVFAFADLDILHSPAFDRSELASLRRVVERAQRMVRIGNWITTWERELGEADFTSGIVVYALENDIVSVDELRALAADGGETVVDEVAEVIRDHDVEDVFLRRWHEELAAAREFERDVDSVDLAAYLDGIEGIMDYHLASRGLK